MLAALVCLLAQTPLDWKPTATMKASAMSEISGIVQSRRSPDRFWVHNDSGDKARIFAIKRDGSVIGLNDGTLIEGAKNVDWEDIAYGDGKIWISDLGNNGNARKDLGVYVVNEFDPVQATTARPLKFLPIRYPDQTAFPPPQRHFDSEAIFVLNGKLHVLTKHRMPSGPLPETGTKLYRLDTEFTDKPNVLKKLDSRDGMKGWVTSADISSDGRWLAVLTQFPVASVWIFDTRGVGDRLLSKPARWVAMTNAKQCEAISFDGSSHLVMTNEQREIFRIRVDQVPSVK